MKGQGRIIVNEYSIRPWPLIAYGETQLASGVEAGGTEGGDKGGHQMWAGIIAMLTRLVLRLVLQLPLASRSLPN